MRTFRTLNFVLGTCLVAAMALTAQAEAQTGENPQAVAYFEAGVAAYEVNNLPLAEELSGAQNLLVPLDQYLQKG